MPTCSLLPRKDIIDCALYGGDDYELLFSCNPLNEELINKLSFKKNIKITKIGLFYKNKTQELTFKGSKIKAKNIME